MILNIRILLVEKLRTLLKIMTFVRNNELFWREVLDHADGGRKLQFSWPRSNMLQDHI